MKHKLFEELEKDYFWREYFFNNILGKIGEEYILSLKEQYEKEREESHVRKRAMMLAAGWKEEARGVYSTPSRPEREPTEQDLYWEKYWRDKLEEFKRSRLGDERMNKKRK